MPHISWIECPTSALSNIEVTGTTWDFPDTPDFIVRGDVKGDVERAVLLRVFIDFDDATAQATAMSLREIADHLDPPDDEQFESQFAPGESVILEPSVYDLNR